MSKVHIVTDSLCQIPSALCTELEIHVIPLPYVWDGITYLDAVNMGPREFFTRLRGSKSIPTTSTPTPGAFIDKFRELSIDGKPILVILGGENFSNMLSAKIAADMVPEAEITILDSEMVSMALGFQVLAAARIANHGGEISEVIKAAQTAKNAAGVVFAVQDLKYPDRGGRFSHIESFIASIIGLIPILELKDGTIKLVERIQTSQNLIPHLLDLVSNRMQMIGPIRLAVLHSDIEGLAWELMNEAKKRFQPDELFIKEITPVLGIHTGPNALGLAYSSRI